MAQNKELENNVAKIFHFNMNSKIIENKNELFFIYNSLCLFYQGKFVLELLYRATRDGDMGENSMNYVTIKLVEY